MQYGDSTDVADTVRMCCSSTYKVRTSAMFRRILKCDNYDCGKSFAFCIQTEHSKSTPRKMWQTLNERKLLLFMQLFQQRLQVDAATLHLEEPEIEERKEDEKKTEGEGRQDEEQDGRERNGSDSGCSEDQCMYGHYEKLIHIERFTVFFRRTVDVSRRRRWQWRSSMLRTFRLGRPR